MKRSDRAKLSDPSLSCNLSAKCTERTKARRRAQISIPGSILQTHKISLERWTGQPSIIIRISWLSLSPSRVSCKTDHRYIWISKMMILSTKVSTERKILKWIIIKTRKSIWTYCRITRFHTIWNAHQRSVHRVVYGSFKEQRQSNKRWRWLKSST